MAGRPLPAGRPARGAGRAGRAPAPAAPRDLWLPGPWAREAEPRLETVAVFGGVYSNHIALRAALADAKRRGATEAICLGDLGAFGPHPDRTAEILREERVPVVSGNYDDAIARGLPDCQCGYTDARDNHFAALSYRYTLSHTAPEQRRWMARFPRQLRFRLGEARVLAFHGSPRRMNEFLWETATPTHLLRAMAEQYEADILLGAHTGIHWSRGIPGKGWYINVGALGRPPNDGRTEVWYAILRSKDGGPIEHEFIPLAYDYEALAAEMAEESLPPEFIETIRSGWWTTCLEVLPAKERARGAF